MRRAEEAAPEALDSSLQTVKLAKLLPFTAPPCPLPASIRLASLPPALGSANRVPLPRPSTGQDHLNSSNSTILIVLLHQPKIPPNPLLTTSSTTRPSCWPPLSAPSLPPAATATHRFAKLECSTLALLALA
ncbi:hypothetical protein AOQ84DRAFT_220447 [Glonium stellatum]|uniref:Uncharacterized protein n=1 Tax=Glonium stellatum TaxID=574774 RepID=A0A8E2EMB3_9PEZI|nr:hypothetical protein AOQ84DRAFT_220447 [Glonium stellatum]